MSSEETAVEANVEPIKRISKVWFIPIVALLIGAWMIFYTLSQQGPLVTISFESADGIEVGTTKLKLRDITIGKVTDLRLNEKFDGIIVSIRMNKNTESLLKSDTEFWVVKPRIGTNGISGLGTILSGDYIEISPGIEKKEKYDFVGLETPPVTPAGTPGIHITLNSDDKFAFSPGDPIIYKGLSVGKFEDVYFNFEERIVYYNAFVKAPYHRLITENTRFWNASGFTLDLKADGISLQTGNVETLLTNGVTFGIPEGMPKGQQITQREYFKVYPSYEAANAERFKKSIEYVVLVSNSIRGLNVGAPVEYRGINLGHVVSTNIHEADHTTLLEEAVKIPVLIRLQPGKVGFPDSDVGLKSMDAQIQHWIKDGLKASLKTGNLLTGSLFIELQHFNNLPVKKLTAFSENKYTIIPTMEDDFSQITRKASVFMDKLNKLPLSDLSKNTNTLLKNLTSTVKELENSSKNLSTLLANANQQNLPQKINEALNQITLATAGISEDSQGYQELTKTLKVLQSTLYDLKPVLKQLNDQPNSLIFVGDQKDDIEPKKATQSGSNQ
ncbi:intermembrane transport protein PqiB [Aliikangiella sp. IMCC44359]|uniref:intermembrane transport protein PqiB n=1 Tax=Aliikangiella sp. IMCC44359 TaxID=3459125 RepID=UPI00403B0610